MRRDAILSALLLVMCLGIGTTALADSYVAGNRSFVPTLLTDDPFVADEITTTVTRIHNLPTGSTPAIDETDFGWEFAKRITSDFGVEIEQGYSILGLAGLRRIYGFDNVEATLKYQLYMNPEHEFLLSAGLAREFGGTGASRTDDTFGTTEPTLYVGKGMGDLPDSLGFLRPFAVTGVADYQIPDEHGPATPRLIEAGLAIEYSLRYLEGNVRYLGLPEFVDRLTPIVEIDYTTPAGRAAGVGTVGYVAPGLVYTGNSFDIGAEALIPTTRATGTDVGVMTMLHLRLDALFPDTLGRPLWPGGGK
jgi:hypothetical protein